MINKNKFTTPILLIAYNRPIHTREVLLAIKKIKPKSIYISFDSHKKGDIKDKIKCLNTRKLIKIIDWDCELKTKFSKKNLGCKIGVSRAIDWFFENVDQGIILEDDCVPNVSFFNFSKKLLNKYKNDSRVMSISGTNPLEKYEIKNKSYLFSTYGSVWGWATWKRAWDKYDKNMKSWEKDENKLAVKHTLASNIQYYFRKIIFNKAYEGKIDTWDYAWSYAKLINSGLSIIPSKNLIKNIGFGDEATHTKSKINAYSSMTLFKIKFPLIHPESITPNREFDFKYFMKFSIYSNFYSLINLPRFFLKGIKKI